METAMATLDPPLSAEVSSESLPEQNQTQLEPDLQSQSDSEENDPPLSAEVSSDSLPEQNQTQLEPDLQSQSDSEEKDPSLSAEVSSDSLPEQNQTQLEPDLRSQSDSEENRGEESVVDYNLLVSFMISDYSFLSPWNWEGSVVAAGENQDSSPAAPWESAVNYIPHGSHCWILLWWNQWHLSDPQENQELPSPWHDDEDSHDDLHHGDEDSSSDACLDDEDSSSGGGNQRMIPELDSFFSYTLDEILLAIRTM